MYPWYALAVSLISVLGNGIGAIFFVLGVGYGLSGNCFGGPMMLLVKVQRSNYDVTKIKVQGQLMTSPVVYVKLLSRLEPL